jgi:hypothetical protein
MRRRGLFFSLFLPKLRLFLEMTSSSSSYYYYHLKLPVVEFEAVFEQELICRPEASLDAIFDDGASARRTCQFLDLEKK